MGRWAELIFPVGRRRGRVSGAATGRGRPLRGERGGGWKGGENVKMAVDGGRGSRAPSSVASCLPCTLPTPLAGDS